jgi:hypothetical protein
VVLALPEGLRADLVIADEAHLCACPLDRTFAAVHQVPATRRLYLTATPRVHACNDGKAGEGYNGLRGQHASGRAGGASMGSRGAGSKERESESDADSDGGSLTDSESDCSSESSESEASDLWDEDSLWGEADVEGGSLSLGLSSDMEGGIALKAAEAQDSCSAGQTRAAKRRRLSQDHAAAVAAQGGAPAVGCQPCQLTSSIAWALSARITAYMAFMQFLQTLLYT